MDQHAPDACRDKQEEQKPLTGVLAHLSDLKVLISWCREGGSNPHDRKGRRILSLFFEILQGVVPDRKILHKAF